MKPTLERLLYVTLLILFLGGICMFLILFDQNRKMNQELDALNTIQTNQSKAVMQLNDSVAKLKADNEYSLRVIICMLQVPVYQRTTNLATHCQSLAAITSPTPVKSNQSSAATKATPIPIKALSTSLLNRIIKAVKL